jgi:DUF4097 and DUF4098 domain-containing protein YvlB
MNRTATAIAGIVLIAVAAGIATGWFWSSEATAQETIGEPIDRVELNADSGNVSIRAADVSETTVKQRFSYRFNKPSDGFEVDDGALKLDDCGWWCTVDYEVTVPRETLVNGSMDSGDLTVIGVAGADIEADSGTVTLRDIAGDVTADMDSGDLTGTGLGGDFTGNIDSGDVELTFTEPVGVTLDMDSGDVELTLPEGSYNVEGETDSGERDIQVGDDPRGQHLLQIDNDSGDVLVRNG